MAEPNPDLDDFFAKKDRKKSKKKYPATDIGTTTVLSSAPPPPKPVINSTPQPENNNTKEDEDNEWLDYKEEQERDYSGLKLRQLTEPEPEPEVQEDDNTDDQDQSKEEPAWKAVAPSPSEPAAAPAAPAKEEAPKNVYISPALRNAALMGPSKLKSKAAPDLSSDSFFPALGTEPPKPVVPGKLIGAPRLAPQKNAWGQPAAPSQAPSSVSLGNRFNTLDTEES